MVIEKIHHFSDEEILKSQKLWYDELLKWIKSEETEILQELEEPRKGIPLKHLEIWSSLHHLEERVERLEQIGGPGLR